MSERSFLKVQAMMISTLELENQEGPLDRHLLEVIVSELFPQSHQAEAQHLSLVLDREVLARLRNALLQLDLPEIPEEEKSELKVQ